MSLDPQQPLPSAAEGLSRLVAARVLDAELAALAWLLVEGGVPVVVAGPACGGRTALADALLEVRPGGSSPVRLAGDAERFDWLPEAVELGWRREPGRPGAIGRAGLAGRGRVSPATSVLVADLDDATPGATWGERARLLVRALGLGYGLVATIRAAGLDEVLARLKGPPVSAVDDELSRLGLVLVLGPAGAPEAGVDHRVVAAHYLRPLARDEHGHVQRLPPAVLATWDPNAERVEHFAWGVAGELAGRTGRRAGDFEREQALRAGRLLAAARATGSV